MKRDVIMIFKKIQNGVGRVDYNTGGLDVVCVTE